MSISIYVCFGEYKPLSINCFALFSLVKASFYFNKMGFLHEAKQLDSVPLCHYSHYIILANLLTSNQLTVYFHPPLLQLTLLTFSDYQIGMFIVLIG